MRLRHVAAAGAAAAFLLAGCGGSPGPSTTDAAASATEGGAGASTRGGPDADSGLRFARCMREHGVDMPDPQPGNERTLVIPKGASQDKTNAAMKACAGKAGGGVKAGGLSEADKDRMLRYARCMRDNGFDMPDPKFDGDAVAAMPMPKGEDRARLEKASKVCQKIFQGAAK
ncbi:hypothetical protein [Bailinhaonella thermotolerans]|uniref:Secreted protein n=1 Tax=Bailinhaonella thermotolerans TaxID=1070861 RepID=A0A3A4AWB0_9ACTN|nr:hypothetical protein [Bailinhaonella thermotolerans]RJL30143.1 hypothetical protein D5H75_24805 [Bailinhaonella thermotolerans]